MQGGFDPEPLTWTALLAQWVRFAQASLALPEEVQGDRWRASVPAVINLQAVTFALADLDRLKPDERALALDRAEILIRSNAAEIDSIWNQQMPSSLSEIARDAHLALKTAMAVNSNHPPG